MHSMTAFARAEVAFGHGQMVVEIRSVNHRLLQTGLHLPRECSVLEPAWRKQIREACARGKVDVAAHFLGDPVENRHEHLNTARLRRLISLSRRIAPAADISRLLELNTVWNVQHISPESLHPIAQQGFDQALETFVEQRECEGARLDKILREHFDIIRQCVTAVRERRPEVRDALRGRWENKLEELKTSMDAHRLEQEIAIELVHTDIEEELDRLDSHIVETEKTLDSSGPQGRKLDFLMQEFAREASTLASKSHDNETSRIAVDLKVVIDQMREQVQNVE